jgi:hypothetical protein
MLLLLNLTNKFMYRASVNQVQFIWSFAENFRSTVVEGSNQEDQCCFETQESGRAARQIKSDQGLLYDQRLLPTRQLWKWFTWWATTWTVVGFISWSLCLLGTCDFYQHNLAQLVYYYKTKSRIWFIIVINVTSRNLHASAVQVSN